MAWYQVVLRGEHFLIHKDGKDAWLGFIKNFYVEAESPEAAEQIAIRRMSTDPDFRLSVKNPADKPPELNIEEVAAIDADPSLKDSDFVYYPDESPPA